MKTRSFNAYAQVAPANINAGACQLCNLSAYIAAASKWLQIFDIAPGSGPGAGAVPLKSIPSGAAAGMIPNIISGVTQISFNKGLVFAMSSTEGTYTADATSFDVWGELEEWDGINISLGASTVGDKTTQVTDRQIWADWAVTTNRLSKLVINELNNVATFVVILPVDALPAAGAPLPCFIRKIIGMTKNNLNFGDSGLDVSSKGHNGCHVYLCDADANGNLKLPLAQVTTGGSIYAEYI